MVRAVLLACALIAGCGGDKGKPEEPVAVVEFRTVERSFGAFDAPAEVGGWLVLQDGWEPLSPGCRDVEYRRRYPAACAPNPGPTDGRYDMRLLQPGRAPVTFHVQAFPTSAPAETLIPDETARLRGGGATVESRDIAGAKALVARRDHTDIDHGETTVIVFSGHLMLRWQVAGPRGDAPIVRAIVDRLFETIAVRQAR